MVKRSLGISAFVVCIALGISFAQTKSTSGGTTEGKTVFLDQKCNNCHSIEAAGITKKGGGMASKTGPPDLSTIGVDHKADFIANFITQEEKLGGKKHPIKFKGNADQLRALSHWLETMKSEKSTGKSSGM